jgi:hypothetical protein
MASKRQKPAASRRSKKPVVTASVSEAPVEKFEASTSKPVEAVIVDGPDVTAKKSKAKRSASKKKKSSAKKQPTQKEVRASKQHNVQPHSQKDVQQEAETGTSLTEIAIRPQSQVVSSRVTIEKEQTIGAFIRSRIFASLALVLAGLGFIFAWLFGIGLLFALPAVALGFFALRVQPLGKHLSVAAIVLGSIATISSAVLVVMWAISMTSVDDASSEWLDMGGAHADAPHTPAQHTYSEEH